MLGAGQHEQVYVVPYPKVSNRWQISPDGGVQPRWSRNGRELFFIAPDSKLMATDLKASGKSFQAGVPHALFQTDIAGTVFARDQYDVTGDGQKFLINSKSAKTVQAITLLVNWPAMLKAR